MIGSVWIIYGLVVIYALSYQFQRPIEPFLVDRLAKGQDATLALGRVESFFNVAQGVGSLVMGYILDKYGVRVGLIVNFLACAGQYSLLAITDSLTMLFLSKVPGMMMGGFLVAQTAMAKVTADGPERLTALGRLTTSYTIGGFAGPYLGGLLGSTGDYFLGAKLAAAASLLALGLVFLLPADIDSVKVREDKDDGKNSKNETKAEDGNWFRQAALVISLVGPLLATKVITGIANNMARSVQAVILKNDLGFNEAMMGSMMSGQFAFGGFANAFLLSPLADLLGGQMQLVVRNCVIIMGIAYLIQVALFAPQLALLSPGSTVLAVVYIGLAMLLAIFQFSLGTSITAKTQELVPKGLVGTLMGIEHSIFAIAGMIGPLLGTTIFKEQGMSGLFLTCALFFLATLPVMRIAFKESKSD